jgi:hypothetical protein
VALSNQLKARWLSGAVPAFAGGRQRARATLGDGHIGMKLLQNNEKLRGEKKSFMEVEFGKISGEATGLK